MAKTSGLGFTLSVADSGATPRDISNDCTNLTFATPHADQNVTGVDKSAIERIQLLADWTQSMTGVLNVAANKSHDVFKTVPSTSVARAVSNTIAAKVLAGNMLLNDYSLARSANGDAIWTVPASLSDGAVPTWA